MTQVMEPPVGTYGYFIQLARSFHVPVNRLASNTGIAGRSLWVLTGSCGLNSVGSFDRDLR